MSPSLIRCWWMILPFSQPQQLPDFGWELLGWLGYQAWHQATMILSRSLWYLCKHVDLKWVSGGGAEQP